MSTNENIWEDIQKIVNTNANTFRTSMDSNLHCMDVGIQALKASDPSIDYSTKEKLHRLFRKEFFLSNSLEDAILFCKDKDNIDRCLFVEDPNFGDYIVAPSYGTLRYRTTKALKFSSVSSSFTGIEEDTGNTTTNIGHLSLKDSSSATTPFESKLKKLLEGLQGAPIASTMVMSKLKQLHKHHRVDTSYAFNRPNFDTANFQKILGTGTVFVTLQTSIKNRALAALESGIDRDIRKYLTSDKFHKKILNNKGSNSILEDIKLGLIATLQGIKGKLPGSTHTKKPLLNSNNSILNKDSKVSINKLPQIRNLQGQFYSLALLQTLINENLQNVISANMGDGSERRILNYRTGRFAASAAVERMSQSRQGMITAFYTYMKYPYQTFEPGYSQGSPATRNPKLLIAKSIREIAATKVGNRLRAVSV